MDQPRFRLRLTEPTWRRIAHDKDRDVAVPAVIWRRDEVVEILVAPHEHGPGLGSATVKSVLLPDDMSGVTSAYWSLRGLRSDPNSLVVEVATFKNGRIASAVLTPDGVFPLERIDIVGPGLPRHGRPAEFPVSSSGVVDRGRQAGALGGEGPLHRVRSLDIALVGVGRTGSWLAAVLARMGVHRLRLYDGDRVEPHNLDAMWGVTPSDVGRFKVHAVAERLRVAAPELQVRAFATQVAEDRDFSPLTVADLLITAVDRPAARLQVATAATLFLRPHLDVATGVIDEGGWLAGTDIRLCLPGSACLLCLGGIPGLDVEALDEGRPWFEDRLGSLVSLNSFAVGAATFLLERLLLAGTIDKSVWVRATSRGGPLEMGEVDHAGAPDCPLCRRAGLGGVRDFFFTGPPGLPELMPF